MEPMELYGEIGLLPEDIELLKESAKRLPLKELDGFIEGMTCMESAEQAYLGLKDWLNAYERSRQEMVGENLNSATVDHHWNSGSAADTEYSGSSVSAAGTEYSGSSGSAADAGYSGSSGAADIVGHPCDSDSVTTAVYNRDSGLDAVARRLRSYDMLYCHLESARRVYEKYRSKGISKRIFINTMKCFPRFMGECQVRNGSRYFERDFWTYRQTSMRLFRIGALEYEMVKEPADGTLSIHLHIPSDADLSESSVDTSLREAEEFFRRYYPVYGGAEYVCGSWLLSPALGKLLPEGSHILAFQRRFVIDRVNEEERSCMRWLFQSPEDAPVSDLPERTRLQRAAKAYLLDGGKIGSGRGRLRKSMQISVMTFNIQHGLDYKRRKAARAAGTGTDEVIDLPLFADAIRTCGADVIGLNEVRGVMPGVSDPEFTPQVKQIAERLGYRYCCFGRAIDIEGKGVYGNGIISRYPILSAETVEIPDPPVKDEPVYYESRCVIRAEIDVGMQKLTVLVTHMGLASSEAKNAVQTVLSLVRPGEPTVLMGDFNQAPDSLILRPLRGIFEDAGKLLEPGEERTFPSDEPDCKIDYIMTAGPVRAVRAAVPNLIVSDHRPHTAVIELGGDSRKGNC